MKTQFVILIVALVLMQMFAESEAIFGAIWNGIKSLFGKRGLRDLDLDDNMFDDMYEPELSAADLKMLQDLFR
uniref:Putative NDBP n=1 Tax=Superstitionia donensis TaxID=311983 RepID=A0A1V1WBL7_9SCOR